MGIKGLNKVIRKLAPHIIREKHIGNYVNSKIAIDSSILIYKYRYGKPVSFDALGKAKDSDNSHVIGFMQKVCFYLRRGIVPVFVFDGKPPTEKQNILDKRSNQKIKIAPHRAFFIYLTNKVLLYAFLRNCALPFLNSPHVIIHCSGG